MTDKADFAESRSATRGPGTNTGHGHVWERPDGVKARCGGPGLCPECSRDDAALVKTRLSKPAGAEIAACPWCGGLERLGIRCKSCNSPWELSNWLPQEVAQASEPVKVAIAKALIASIATSELEELAVQSAGQKGRPIPVHLSVNWILKARALLS